METAGQTQKKMLWNRHSLYIVIM